MLSLGWAPLAQILIDVAARLQMAPNWTSASAATGTAAQYEARPSCQQHLLQPILLSSMPSLPSSIPHAARLLVVHAARLLIVHATRLLIVHAARLFVVQSARLLVAPTPPCPTWAPPFRVPLWRWVPSRPIASRIARSTSCRRDRRRPANATTSAVLRILCSHCVRVPCPLSIHIPHSLCPLALLTPILWLVCRVPSVLTFCAPESHLMQRLIRSVLTSPQSRLMSYPSIAVAPQSNLKQCLIPSVPWLLFRTAAMDEILLLSERLLAL